MKLRIDYLNKHREVRHIFHTIIEENNERKTDGQIDLGFDIYQILKEGATDVYIYNLTKEKGTTTNL